MGFRRAPLALAALLLLGVAAPLAHAQDVGKPPPPGTPPPSSNSSAATQPAAGANAVTPATNPTTPAPPAGPAPNTGYTYGDSHRSSGTSPTKHHTRAKAHHAGPIATLPGFEMLPEGGSRLFVQLTSNVQVAEKTVAGGVTYVLKGAHVAKRNNENALVTVHFNTPVSRARLMPAGGDLHFVVDLRQNVKPTWKLVPAKDGASVLEIDFPGGDYLPHDSTADSSSDDASKSGKAATPDTSKK